MARARNGKRENGGIWGTRNLEIKKTPRWEGSYWSVNGVREQDRAGWGKAQERQNRIDGQDILKEDSKTVKKYINDSKYLYLYFY